MATQVSMAFVRDWDGDELLSERELSRQFKLARTTLWRLRNAGLPHVVVGVGHRRLIRYDPNAVHQWLESRSDRPTADIPSGPDPAWLTLPPCHWTPSVALDPKHRPQSPNR